MRRRMLASIGGAKLPYDAEVDYLFGDGASWIDTEIVPDNSVSIEVEARADAGIFEVLIGFGPNSDGPYSQAIVIQYFKEYCMLVRGNYPGKPTVSIRDFKKIRLDKDKVVVDGSEIAFAGADVSVIVGCRVFVFAGGGYSKAFRACKSGIQIRSAKVYKGEECVWSGKAVRVGNEGCMYDEISKTVFHNAGTGTFGFGPDKPAQ